jgi:hypothetical protein
LTETGIEKLKRRKSSPDDEISAELTWAREVKHYVMRSINIFILFGITKNCQIIWRSQLLYQFIRRAIKLTAVIIEASASYKILWEIRPLRLSPYADEIIGYHQWEFRCNNRPLIRFFLIC